MLDRIAVEFQSSIVGDVDERLRRMVAGMDADGNGELSRDELGAGCGGSFGVDLSALELDALVSAFDSNGDGSVSFAEFQQAVISHLDHMQGRVTVDHVCEQICAALDEQGMSALDLMSKMDRDHHGLSHQQLRTRLRSALGLALSDESVEALFRALDADNSGSVEVDELATKLSRHRGEATVRETIDAIVEWMKTNGSTVLDLVALFDRDGDSLLSVDELRNGLAATFALSGRDLDALVWHFDRDGDGSVALDEICQAIERARQRFETPETMEGEELVTLFEGVGSVVYQVTGPAP